MHAMLKALAPSKNELMLGPRVPAASGMPRTSKLIEMGWRPRTSLRDGLALHLGAVLVGHLHPRHRARRRGVARRGRPPDGAAAYGRRVLRPLRRPHPRAAGRRLRGPPIADAARASFASLDLDEDQAGDVRVGRGLDLTLPGDGPHAVFAPGGQFLALDEQRGQQARSVAVFVG